MPTYDYECEKCGKSFEAFQSMKDKPFEKCPESTCGMSEWGHGKVRRLIGTGAGLIFKGSGFYITDYRSEGYKKPRKVNLEQQRPLPPQRLLQLPPHPPKRNPNLPPPAQAPRRHS